LRRWLVILLLASFGLNLGLGYRLVDVSRDRTATETTRAAGEAVEVRGRASRSRQPGLGPSLADTAAWDRRAQRRLERMQRSLDLDPEDAAALARVHHESARRVRDLGRQLHRRREDLHGLLWGAESDPERIRAAASALATVQSRLDSAVVEGFLAELAVIPPPQRERYLGLIPWQRWGAMPGHGPSRRGHR
jgi:Spy/CpxP family protein refolding chaperone